MAELHKATQSDDLEEEEDGWDWDEIDKVPLDDLTEMGSYEDDLGEEDEIYKRALLNANLSKCLHKILRRFDVMKFLMRKEIATMIGISLVQLWRGQRAGLFPCFMEIGPRARGLSEAVVTEWMSSRPSRQGSGVAK